MRLSEAIRLGAMLKPHGVNMFDPFDYSCALGAACEALGIVFARPNIYADYVALEERYPWMRRASCSCPVCNSQDFQLTTGTRIVWHLNDEHEWTRERIADWVATVEPADVEPVGETEAIAC